MNKKLFAVSSLLLGAITVFGSAGCATKDISKITPNETTKTVNTQKLNIDSSSNTSVSVDGSGLALITTRNYSGSSWAPTLTSTTYSLFNVEQNSVVYSMNVYPNSDGVVYQPITRMRDGFYYSSVTNPYESKTKYTLYDKTGVAFSDLEGSFDGCIFVDSSCNRYYLDVNGKVVIESNPLTNILGYYDDKIGDYYLVGENTKSVYDSEGKYLYTLDQSEFEYPEMKQDTTEWSVGNYCFLQYSYPVHDDEKDYDYVDDNGSAGLQKYDLVTKRWDLKKGTIKEVDFDYIVDDVYGSGNDDSVILEIKEIDNKQVLSNEIIQSFDKNGDVLTDLQALAPGADDIAYVSDKTIVLSAANAKYVVQKNKVVATFPAETSFKEEVAVLNRGNNMFIYNLKGEQRYAFYNVKEYTAYDGGYVIRFENSIQKYSIANNTCEELSRIYSQDDEAVMTSQYVVVYNSSGRTYNIYSLVPGVDNMLYLTEAQAIRMSFYVVGTYTINVDETTKVTGKIYSLTTTNTYDPSITITTYYNVTTKEAKPDKGFLNFL